MSSTPNPSAADRTIESLKWAHDLGAKTFVEVVDGDKKFLVSNEILHVSDLDDFGDVPKRTRRNQFFADVESLAAYINPFESEATLLVGSLSKKTVVATLDYDTVYSPNWAEHTATLQSIVTPEWAALRKVNEKWLTQTETADFFDTWNHVIVEPSAAHMAEVAMNLQGTVNATFEARIVRANGSASFVCREETETNNVKVPNKVHVSVSPFEHSVLVDVLLLVRFRIENGKPRFQLVIQNADRIETEALRKTFKDVEEATGKTVLVAP